MFLINLKFQLQHHSIYNMDYTMYGSSPLPISEQKRQVSLIVEGRKGQGEAERWRKMPPNVTKLTTCLEDGHESFCYFVLCLQCQPEHKSLNQFVIIRVYFVKPYDESQIYFVKINM